MRKKRITKQFNVRISPRIIDLLNATADKMEKTQGEIVEEAIEIIARRKKVSLEEGQVS